MKRLIIATLAGMAFGVVCYYFAKSGGGEILAALRYQIISSRTLIGFAIGISCFKCRHWTLHGLVMGLIFSIPIAFSGMLADNPDFSGKWMFLSTMIMGAIYGVLIELITSVLFKARQK